MKNYAKNPIISDETFTNDFLLPYVLAGGITNKLKEEWHLNKTKVSELLSGKSDVPGALRKAQSMVEIKERTIENFKDFIEDYLKIDDSDVRTLAMNLPSNDRNKDLIWGDANLAELLTELLFIAIQTDNRVSPTEVILWKHGVNTLSVISGDIFKYGFKNRRNKKNIVVIPVNTLFSTHVTRTQENEPFPLVSENTLHGQWLIRIIDSGISEQELSKRIHDNLAREGIVQADNDQYPIGTIAIIETESSVYWLLAISVFDNQNVAHSSPVDVQTAIEQLLIFYNRRGQGYDIYIPLIGTGRSRSGLSSEESFKLITDTMMKHKELLQGTLKIILLPECYAEVQNGIQN